MSEETNLVQLFDFQSQRDAIQLLNGGIFYHTGAQSDGVAIDPSDKFAYGTNGNFFSGTGWHPRYD